MKSKLIIHLMSHMRVLEVPLLLTVIAMLFNMLGLESFFIGCMVYAVIRLFINIRFKLQQDKFQEAILNHLDDIIDDMEEQMGFNKRYITKESILSIYNSSGLEGVKTHLRKADALIYNDLFSGIIVEMYKEIGTEVQINPWKEIEKEILKELPNQYVYKRQENIFKSITIFY